MKLKTPLPVVNNPICFQNILTKHLLISLCPWRGAEKADGERQLSHNLMSNFALKTNCMGFLLGQITWRINVICDSWMKWTWHHSKLAAEEVSFYRRLKVVLLQPISTHYGAPQTQSGTSSTNIYTLWSSQHYGLGCHAPMLGIRLLNLFLFTVYMLTWWLVSYFSPRQNGRHFADNSLKRIFMNDNFYIPIQISLKFVPKCPIDNVAALVQVMAWYRTGDKPLPETMLTQFTNAYMQHQGKMS